MTQTFVSKILKINNLSKTIKLFRLEIPKGKDFRFFAGQFVLVSLMVKGKDVRRSYSIASSPFEKKYIDLVIRIKEDGVLTPRLFKLKRGDKVKVKGPFGKFVVQYPPKGEVVFIAAGCGLGPLRAMIHELLRRNPKQKIKLIFGFRYQEDFLFKEEFEKLEKKYKNFKLISCLSKPDESWHGHVGRVTAVIPKVIKDFKGKEAYICGPGPMISDTSKLLNRMGFDEKQVHFERWG